MLHVAVTPIQCNHPTLSTSSPEIRTLKTLWAIYLQIFGSLKVENARSHTTLHTYLIHRTILYLWYLCVCANFVIKYPNDWTLKECQFKISHAQHVLQCSSMFFMSSLKLIFPKAAHLPVPKKVLFQSEINEHNGQPSSNFQAFLFAVPLFKSYNL